MEAAVVFKISVSVRISVHWSLEFFVIVCFIRIRFADHMFSELPHSSVIFWLLVGSFTNIFLT